MTRVALARRRRERVSAPTSVIAAAVAVALVSLIPLGFIVVYALTLSPTQSLDLLVRPRMGELLFNTVRLVVGGCALSLVLGVGCAWLVERSDLPLRPMWHLLATAPLAVPAFVNSYGWSSLAPSAEGFIGALLIVTLSYFPLVYLPTAASLRGLDPALEEVAYSQGLSRCTTFVRVTLPQLVPAMIGGALLVGLHLLAEFGALQMLRYPTFTTAIYDQYQSSFSSAGANVLAAVLVLCCLALLMVDLRLRAHRRFARVGSGVPRQPVAVTLGHWTRPAQAALALLAALSLGVPLYSLTHWMIVGSSLSFPLDDLAAAAGTTIVLGLAAALLAVLAAAPLAWLAVRFRSRLSTTLERSGYVANSLPGIVVALALVTVTIRVAQPLYQTVVLLLVAYVILFLPRALVTMRSAIEQVPPIFEDVAHGLGASNLATARRITLPIIAPGVGAGGALVFLAVGTELTATLLLAPIGTSTLATRFWASSSSVAYAEAAPYAVLMVLISLPATLLLSRRPAAVLL